VILSLVVYGRFLEKPAAWALLYKCGGLAWNALGQVSMLPIVIDSCLGRIAGTSNRWDNIWKYAVGGVERDIAYCLCSDRLQMASHALWIVGSLYLENHTAHCYWDTLRTTLLNMLEGRHFPWES